MKEYINEEVTVITSKEVSTICDVCKKKIMNNDENLFEYKEIYTINFTGGYASAFGDGTIIECDICQKCLRLMIQDYCRVVGEHFGNSPYRGPFKNGPEYEYWDEDGKCRLNTTKERTKYQIKWNEFADRFHDGEIDAEGNEIE